MGKIEYDAIYKCRLCRSRFANSCIICKTLDVIDLVCRLNEESFVEPEAGGSLSITIPHFCFNGSIGIADFCGFKINDKYNYKKENQNEENNSNTDHQHI